MKIGAIIGILENASYSLTGSLAWKMTTSLQRKSGFVLKTSGGVTAGGLVGMMPILQPIPVSAEGGSFFLLMMKAVFEVPNQFNTKQGEKYSVVDQASTSIGTISAGIPPIGRRGAQYSTKRAAAIVHSYNSGGTPAIQLTPFLLVADSTPTLSSESLIVLRDYTSSITSILWPAMPINLTTHYMSLSSTGRFMHASEIRNASLMGGKIVIEGSSISVQPSPPPLLFSMKSWRGAGIAVEALGKDLGSDSCSGASSGGGGGGGSGSYSGGSGSSSYSSSGGSSYN